MLTSSFWLVLLLAAVGGTLLVLGGFARTKRNCEVLLQQYAQLLQDQRREVEVTLAEEEKEARSRGSPPSAAQATAAGPADRPRVSANRADCPAPPQTARSASVRSAAR